jgi:hypothetical protein
MDLKPQQLAAALDAVAEHLGLVNSAFFRALQGDPYGDGNAEWNLKIAYTQLLALAEAPRIATTPRRYRRRL